MLDFSEIKKVLIVAPHPDDAEIAMGGTILKMIASNIDVQIVDLTDGEPTPYGSKEIRAQETALASEVLGIRNRTCLNMPNRRLKPTLKNRKILSEVIRVFQPDILFGPCRPDWHPDHIAATELIEAARFEAKYHKTNMKGSPHWTPKLYYYFSPHRFEYQNVAFVVDISDFWHQKVDAIASYKSQIKNSSKNQCISLIDRCKIIARYFGLSIDKKYGEPFVSYDNVSVCLQAK